MLPRIIKLALILVLLLTISCSSEDGPESTTESIITPLVGVGKITFQDDGNKVMDELGMYAHLSSTGSFNNTAFAMWYDNGQGFLLDYIDTDGLSLQEIADMSSELIDLEQKIIAMVVMSSFQGKTSEGIGIGSSRAEVIATYGEPTKVGSLTEDYEDLGLNFWYNTSDHVRRIDIMP